MEGLGLNRLRALLPGIALLTASTLVAVVLAELAVRLAAPQPLAYVTPGLYESMPAPQRFGLRPGYEGTVRNGVEFDTQVHIDANGLRIGGKDMPTKKADKNIVVVGDSFTFGWGVEAEETFVARLDDAVPEATVVNAGIPGTGMPDYDAWLEASGGAASGSGGTVADAVVVAVFLGNDLLDATEAHRAVAVDDGLVAAAPDAPSSRGLRGWLNDQSHLARLVKRALPPGVSRALRSTLGLGEPWAERYLRDVFGSYAESPPPLVAEGRAETARAFASLVARARERDAAVAMVLIPAALQVDDGRWQAALDQLSAEGAAYDREVPSRFFQELAARHDVPVVDLLPTMRAAHAEAAQTESSGALYFRYDPHWTVVGHRTAADAITPVLRRLLDPPAAPAAPAP